MALLGFQYLPVSLDVNEVCFEEELDIPNTREKLRKSQHSSPAHLFAIRGRQKIALRTRLRKSQSVTDIDVGNVDVGNET